MNALLITILLMLGITDQCQPGNLVLYEDMSYSIKADSDVATCNIAITEEYASYDKVKLMGRGFFEIRRTFYSFSLPFPEGIVITYLGSGAIFDQGVHEPR